MPARTRTLAARDQRSSGGRGRLLAALVIVAVLVLGLFAAQSKRSTNDQVRTTAPAGNTSTGQMLVVLDPRLLPLPEGKFIDGQWTRACGSAASGQYNCRWNRDEKDPGFATGATTVAMNARLYLSIEDATKDFESALDGANPDAITTAITRRGIDKDQIHVSPISLDTLGVDQQAAFRSEFTQGSRRFIQNWYYLRVKNIRVYFNTFGEVSDTVEPPNLPTEGLQIARLQAEYMKTFPLSEPGPIPTATP